MEKLVFVTLATLLLFCALRVVWAASPLRSALALIMAQVAVSGLYVMLAAPFVASLQILLYAGAVMVLFVFVIMLLNLGAEPRLSRFGGSPLRFVGAGAVACSVIGLIWMPTSTGLGQANIDGSLHHVGALLLGRYSFAFEAVSVLLLTAVVGSVVLSLKRLT